MRFGKLFSAVLLLWCGTLLAQTPDDYSLLEKVKEGQQLLASAPLLYPRTLQVGMRGADVAALQRWLQEKGFFPSRTGTSGYFSSITKNAVEAFQRARGLSPTDGIVGYRTLEVMEREGLVLSLSDRFYAWQGTFPDARKALLAVLDKSSGVIELVPVHYARRVDRTSGRSLYTITPLGAAHLEWEIVGISGTGMAAVYEVVHPSGKVVVANLWPDFIQRGGRKFIEEIVYTGPATGLVFPGVIDEGAAYQNGILDGVFAGLSERRVAFRFMIDGQTLLQLAHHPKLGKDFLRLLMSVIGSIEHIDEQEHEELDPEFLVEKVLVILGTNLNRAFLGSDSSKGAFGWPQFMPCTYVALPGQYANAGLIYAPLRFYRRGCRPVAGLEEFREAMRDHHNALKAMACLIDRELATLVANPTVAAYLQSTSTAEEEQLASDHNFPSVYAMRLLLLAAAAYNHGTGRISRYIARHGSEWFLAPRVLPRETRIFTQKALDAYAYYAKRQNKKFSQE